MQNHAEAHKPHSAGHDHMAGFRRRFWISLALTVPVLALDPMIQEWLGVRGRLAFSGEGLIQFGLATIVYFHGGMPFLAGFARDVRARKPGMMTLIALAITVAYAYSTAVVLGFGGQVIFWELVTLIDIMLLGHWIEMKSVMGASRALDELARLMPSTAHRLSEDGSAEDVPVDRLLTGDKIIIKPGEKAPADGRVVEGKSHMDEAMLTGESKPIEKSEGDSVFGGSVNGGGSLTVEVSKAGDESYLAQVIELVRSAQESKSRGQVLADRAASWLTVIALAAGAATFAAWLGILGQGFQFAIERAVTVMVITCPHALGLAVPLVVAVSTSLAAQAGLLVRNRAAFEKARRIDAVIFDKTGTLTEGRFTVTDTLAFGESRPEDVLCMAAAVEARSEHPVARAILDAAGEAPRVSDFEAVSGVGVKGRVEGRAVEIVSARHVSERGLDTHADEVRPLEEQGKTVVYVLADGRPLGAIALGDVIRPESREAVAKLRRSGVRCIMLTGDSERVARWVAEEIGLDEYFARILPKEKTERVKEIQERGMTVAMAGDGINDAPALAQADVGIAMGAGTDVAIETADIILVGSNPMNVADLVALARATYRKIVQNLFWATGYNVVAIPLAAGVLYSRGVVLSPAAGAILMSASTVIVAVNAQLLRRRKAEG